MQKTRISIIYIKDDITLDPPRRFLPSVVECPKLHVFFQKWFLKHCKLFHIMPFDKIIDPVKKIGLEVIFHRFFLDLNF